MNQHSLTRNKYYFPLIGVALATASLFQFSLPVFAVGTNAGVSLKNTATATYENEAGTPYNAISNEVTVTVGKIAGITNVPNGLVDSNGGSVLPEETISFDFLITNTGNDATNIFVPDATKINGNAQNVTVDPNSASSVQYSTNGGTSFINRPADGIVPNVALNTSIIVRVTGTVSSTVTTGDTISVRLGDTGNNTADINSPDFPGTQNQPDAGGANDPQDQDVRTLTSTTATVTGDPVNGQREASATNTVTVGSNPLALTRIRKTNAGFTNGADASSLSDNVITYNLELDVLNQKLAGYNNFTYNPAALEGRDYSGANPGSFTGAGITSESNLILISDAIPKDTTLDKATVGADVTAPNGWTRVYTDDVLTVAPEKAEWETDATALTGAITRVGWVYDASTNKIAAGTTQTGFSFKVVTSSLTNTATSIYNMAQTFGSTDNGGAGVTGAITFDESGDENPNNFNDDGTSGPDETVGDSNNAFGVANPGNNENNVDVNNNNTATGTPGGEVNKVRVTPPAVASNLRNGPANLPDAIGGIFGATTADDNHDFQNLGVATPAVTGTTQAQTYDPDSITFTNTVKNPTAAQITNVILQPISPEALTLGGTAASLPNGTEVTITYSGVSATYTYDNTGTGSFTLSGGTPITVPSINANASINYTVAINLPDGTELSTSDNGSGENIGGYPVPIAAYKDSNNTGTGLLPSASYTAGNGLTTQDTYNVTVNQVYAGYLKLVKKARVLRANASGQYSLVTGMNFNDPDANKKPAPGDIIEYQVAYSNISDPQATGANSVLLQANDVRIIENGTVGANNWALDTTSPDDGDTIIDTLHVPSSAQDSNSGTITYFKGTTGSTASSTTDKLVTSYIDTVANVAPGVSGTFTFQRKVTDASDIKTLTP
ncbi:hypothetical protein C7B62_14240 [Pleurocapsa sp. CCALA 161]|uniref:beta strand repeat-containing protein n=1 Tax=Pleurocapsa sp. CCALA 161 TaxID=2107688 RepID=UPI000D06087F|nr:hypothetical protein [Pleurocapsa sp. CCALA 161]PSB09168.1 hypothetical protein C7B62_14240 [Pleurocapsa sp. CCALA 161]